jgi:hypothetical protein
VLHCGPRIWPRLAEEENRESKELSVAIPMAYYTL